MGGLAAIQYAADGFDPRRKMMGRQMAGETFLAAWLAYSGADPVTAYIHTPDAAADFRDHAARLGYRGPAAFASMTTPQPLVEAGALWLADPSIANHAWERRWFGDAAWSIVGVTHTISTHAAMDRIAAIPLAPLHPWDALICTSRAAKAVVESVIEAQHDFLAQRFGGRVSCAMPQRPVIPLGVPCEALASDPAARARWRDRLGIPADGIVVLQYGRISLHGKAHIVPLYLALVAAAAQTGITPHLVLAGKFGNVPTGEMHHMLAAHFAGQIVTHFVDGDDPDLPALRAAADIGTLLSDNIQETFGLAPVELMAAGLPVVASDWDGLRDTIEHGVTGFLADTLMPPPGAGDAVARQYALGHGTYDMHIAAAAQSSAIDIGQAASAFATLFADPALRARMGAAGRVRARALFDWPVVIDQYCALLGDLAALRRSAPAHVPVAPPTRRDPFATFAAYPTAPLSPDLLVTARVGGFARLADLPGALEVTMMNGAMLPPPSTLDAIVACASARPITLGGLRAIFAGLAEPQYYRAIGALLKYGFLSRA